VLRHVGVECGVEARMSGTRRYQRHGCQARGARVSDARVSGGRVLGARCQGRGYQTRGCRVVGCWAHDVRGGIGARVSGTAVSGVVLGVDV
jgi:hypothetical protein